MNVLILADLIEYTGVGQYMVQLAGGYVKDSRIDKIVLAYSTLAERNDVPKEVIVEKLPATKNVISYLGQLHQIMKNYKIDIVHSNHRMQTFMMRLYQILYGKTPTVWTCHTVPYPNNWIKRLLGYYGHKTIAISSEAEAWIHDELHIDSRRIDKILNGVDNTSLIIPSIDKSRLKEVFFKTRFNKTINGVKTKFIVSHGRLDPVKGLDLIIEAFVKLSNEQKENVKVIFSGDMNVPYYSELISLIEKYNLQNNFFFTGWVSSTDILSVADLMIQPSHREGFPLAVLEAFFMHIPVIRTKVGGYEDMKNCVVGISVNDVDAIRLELHKWLSNPSCYNDLIERAYKFAQEEGTISVMTNRTINTYRRAIEICQA